MRTINDEYAMGFKGLKTKQWMILVGLNSIKINIIQVNFVIITFRKI